MTILEFKDGKRYTRPGLSSDDGPEDFVVLRNGALYWPDGSQAYLDYEDATTSDWCEVVADLCDAAWKNWVEGVERKTERNAWNAAWLAREAHGFKIDVEAATREWCNVAACKYESVIAGDVFRVLKRINAGEFRVKP